MNTLEMKKELTTIIDATASIEDAIELINNLSVLDIDRINVPDKEHLKEIVAGRLNSFEFDPNADAKLKEIEGNLNSLYNFLSKDNSNNNNLPVATANNNNMEDDVIIVPPTKKLTTPEGEDIFKRAEIIVASHSQNIMNSLIDKGYNITDIDEIKYFISSLALYYMQQGSKEITEERIINDLCHYLNGDDHLSTEQPKAEETPKVEEAKPEPLVYGGDYILMLNCEGSPLQWTNSFNSKLAAKKYLAEKAAKYEKINVDIAKDKLDAINAILDKNKISKFSDLSKICKKLINTGKVKQMKALAIKLGTIEDIIFNK